MTSITWPDHLLTLDEWDAMPEEGRYRRAELVEGVLQTTPSPSTGHQRGGKRLTAQLDPQLVAAGLESISEVDVVLVAGDPPTVRCPDLVVVSSALLDELPKRFMASDVVLAVEIVSPGSARVDRIMKLADYAEAGIEHYWIIDLDGAVTLDVFRLVDGRYERVHAAVTGTVSLDAPLPLTLDLAALVP